MTILIVARHGNTFEPGETPRRVGARTDLPLTAKGAEHGRNLGLYLKKINLTPDAVYCSQLKRTIQTANEAIVAADINLLPQPLALFNEINYGPDENKPEDQVIARVGENALADWEEKAIMPPGWSPDVKTIRKNWDEFSHHILLNHQDKIILAVTSNGIARFALGLSGDFVGECARHGLKLATGAFGVLEHDRKNWSVQSWNTRP